MTVQASSRQWEPPGLQELLRWPLPELAPSNRWLMRALVLLARRRVLGASGWQDVQTANDPFILALNHSTRIEALLVPTLLMLSRNGRLIHFVGDWNFRLIPGVGLIFRRAGIITVTAKPARPRILDVLRPFYRGPENVLDQARACLASGRSIGIFPEGTVNRDPRRLLPGRAGAALLSLETGAPVIPVGIRFPQAPPDRPISDRDQMEIRIGAPMLPPPGTQRVSAAALAAWHSAVMSEIAKLSGKTWTPSDRHPASGGPR